MKKIVCCLCLVLCGCVSLSHPEKVTLRELKQYGIKDNVETVANPAFAGILNLFPGIGNFYLGMGEGAETGQCAIGVLNFLLWPVSVLWGVPQAIIDANTINKKETVYYYLYNPVGKRELQKLKGEEGMPVQDNSLLAPYASQPAQVYQPVYAPQPAPVMAPTSAVPVNITITNKGVE